MAIPFIQLVDCLLAYRKAKAEGYYENTHFHALAFAEYEKNLIPNLKALLSQLTDESNRWTRDLAWLGDYSYAPKSIDTREDESRESIYFRFLDPIEEWKRRFASADDSRFAARFRLVIKPTINFQIVSALWVIKVGYKFDATLNSRFSYGNRLRRRVLRQDEQKVLFPDDGVNLDCVGLFAPYFSAYRRWRENGLNAMRSSLEGGNRIIAITMDIQQFYHRVNPAFLLRKEYLKSVGIELTKSEFSLTKNLLDAISTWYSSTPDHEDRPQGALPVGLSASKIISNALLVDVDRNITRALRPLYYGRYVDDFFIVLSTNTEFRSGTEVMQWLAREVPGTLSYWQSADKSDGIRIQLKYAEDSELVLVGNKQKIFNLAGPHGLDLVGHISDQIRRQSSEHRLLPIIPDSSEAMASRALLAQPTASLEVDALRKADVISVRRLGLALLIRDMEAYERDLPPSKWQKKRQAFYGLVERHIITPQGFFDFFSYIHRVFALMIACGDYDEASSVVRRLVVVAQVIANTSTAGTEHSRQFESCKAHYARALLQAGLQAASVARIRGNRRFLNSLRALQKLSSAVAIPKRMESVRRVATDLQYADFGRRPYRGIWLTGGRSERANPVVPSGIDVRRLLRLGAIRDFRREAGLRVPYWPALVFPTRPIGLSDLTFAAPSLLHTPSKLRAALFAFRGARARREEGFGLTQGAETGRAPELLVGTRFDHSPRLALPSFYTGDDDWKNAAVGRPRLSLQRYERTKRLINEICRSAKSPTYVIFPECSVPRRWASSIAYKLAQQRISFVAGLEYRRSVKGLHNEALVSLTTDWPWYPTSVSYIQAKMAPAHEEARQLRKVARAKLATAKPAIAPVYVHGNFCFGLLICSDLTTVENRMRFQGAIDALLVIEWNQDVETFGFLVEATAHDLHGYIVQVNNRRFGDSRIRVPRKIDYERDLVRVKGGMADYFVIAELDIANLRKFQRSPMAGSKALFKPLPIGFQMSDRRRETG